MYKIILINLTLFLMTSCGYHQEETFCVTYIATRTSLNTFGLFITYQDSTGLTTCYTKEERWVKQICLPPNTSAFLLVQPNYTSPMDWEASDDCKPEDWISGVLAKICCGTAVRWQNGSSFALASMEPGVNP